MTISSGFGRGLTDSSSIILGYFPVAVSFGVAAVSTDISPLLAVLISICIYAGASQFILLLLLAEHTSVLSMVFIVVLVNLRHVFYGPALLHELTLYSSKQVSRPYALMAFGLTDEVFAAARVKVNQLPPYLNKNNWYLGLQLGAYGAWVGGTIVGAYLAKDWLASQPILQHSLAFVLPALFFALLLDMVDADNRRMLLISAVATTLSSFVLPTHISLIVGMLLGSLAALMLNHKREPNE